MPCDVPKGTVSCGPLRREPDGSWFHDSVFLGRDGDPQRAVVELSERVAWVAMRLAEALDLACHELRKNGGEAELHHALLALSRFHRWQATGSW